jgi:hypothetical protein
MYYTGINPLTGKTVYVCTDYHEKQLQRALLQYARPENANLVREALRIAGREDLIGNGPECLVRPAFGDKVGGEYKPRRVQKTGKTIGGTTQKTAASSKYTRQKSALGTKKLSRVFGEDAGRIMREVNRLSGTAPKRKNAQKTTKKRK